MCQCRRRARALQHQAALREAEAVHDSIVINERPSLHPSSPQSAAASAVSTTSCRFSPCLVPPAHAGDVKDIKLLVLRQNPRNPCRLREAGA